MKAAGWLALVAIVQIIVFNAIINPNEIVSHYVVLIALGLSIYTGMAIRE